MDRLVRKGLHSPFVDDGPLAEQSRIHALQGPDRSIRPDELAIQPLAILGVEHRKMYWLKTEPMSLLDAHAIEDQVEMLRLWSRKLHDDEPIQKFARQPREAVRCDHKAYMGNIDAAATSIRSSDPGGSSQGGSSQKIGFSTPDFGRLTVSPLVHPLRTIPCPHGHPRVNATTGQTPP